AGSSAARCGGAVGGAEQHFLAASAAGKQADADLDQASVKLGVGLAGRSVQRDFSASAEAQSERADHYGFRRELDGLGHALKLADGEVDVIPLFFLHTQEQQHEVCTDREICGVVGHDEGVEVVSWSRG